ncbi:hypothetical protein BC962_0493 [Gillisia mitskevichiae]|uniref:Uncharacterized protein n=1 Tax=Gillisia mitskevichiae TaxID=270921 RepID=A0A495PZ76_9FLAO|nr:hypothetical protein [Gillisia mitskevichiae]RKS55530.1 hypothetical protein BC962_0493 [Gillisia mitskevichiae]
MKYYFAFIFALFLSSSYAQEKDSIVNFNAELDLGELFSFDNRSIQFKKVISDSRCPTDVTCIWAGEAKVLIAVMQNGRQVEEKIISLKQTKGFSFGLSDSKNSYSLDALDLYPFPKSTHKIADSEYCLKIRLSKS